MGFSTGKRTENGLELVVLKDEESGTEAALLPAFGALLHGFSIQTEEGFLNVIDHYSSFEEAQKEIGLSFKSARLSPFPCRLPEGKYHHNGKKYELGRKFLDGSAIHGLLYDKAFQPVEVVASEQEAAAKFQYEYKKDDTQYPFDYTCTVEYILRRDAVLEIRSTAKNNGEGKMPIADGWHPYFKLGGKVDDWLLYFDSDAMLEFNEKLIPTGRFLQQNLFKQLRKIGSLFLDNCFLLNKGTGQAACELINLQSRVKVSFYPEKQYPYLQLFTPPHRNSIAIENLSAAPDSFNNKMGLLMLEPGHSQTFTVQYKLSLQ
jgi:aldose 1-epimerase